MAWSTVTGTPGELGLLLQAQELLLNVGSRTIDPDSLRVALYGKRKSDTESEIRMSVLYQDISGSAVTWHAVPADAESADDAISGSPNLPSLRMVQYGEPSGKRFVPKVLVIYST